MAASDVFLNVSGLVGTEQADRTTNVCVLVGYDSANDTFVPVSVTPEGWFLSSGVN